MMRRTSIAHVMARACLAAASALLLAIPAHGRRCDRACAPARSTDASTGQHRDPAVERPRTEQHPPSQRSTQPPGQHDEAELLRLSAEVHPIGLASDGHPHDTRWRPAAARASHNQQ